MNLRVDLNDANQEDVRQRLQDEVTRRWTQVAREVKRAILQNDALSIGEKAPRLAQPTADKAQMFRRWLDEKLMRGVAGYDGGWLEPHIDMASKRGVRRVAVGDAFDPDQPRDDSGKWTAGVSESITTVQRIPRHRADFAPDPSKPLGTEAKAYVLQHGRETNSEYLVAIDKTGKPVDVLSGGKSEIAFTAALDAAAANSGEAMVVHHNHPSSSSLSGPDISQLGRPGIAAIWAHGNNGRSYRAELTPEARANVLAAVAKYDDSMAGQRRLYATHERASEVISDAMGPQLYSPNKETRDLLLGIANLNHAGWVNGALHQAGIIKYHSDTENMEAETARSFGIQGAIGEAAFQAKELFYGKGGGGANRPDRSAQPVRHAGDMGIAFGEAQAPARRHAAQDGDDRAGGAASDGRRQFGDYEVGDEAQQNLGFLLAQRAPSARICHAATVSGLATICEDVSTRAHDSVRVALMGSARPMQVARLVDQAMGHGLMRTRMLAEHAVTQAYSQATLDALEAAGVTHVGTISEHAAKHDVFYAGSMRDAEPDGDELVVEGEDGALFRVVKTAEGYAVIAMDFDPDEPRDETGKWTSSGSVTPSLSHTGGTEFVSPSVASHLDFDEARKALDGGRQKAMLQVADEIDRALGLKESERSVIGAWSDGAENSVLANLPDASWDEIKLSAAMKGFVGDQKAVLAFKQDDGGDALLYQMHAAGDLKSIHQRLLADGLAFHSLAPTSDGADVYVADLDGSAHDGIKRAAEDFHGQVTYQRGHAEFLGTTQETGTDREIRDDARRAYEGLINQSPLSRGAEVWRRNRDRWSSTLAAAVVDALFGAVRLVLAERDDGSLATFNQTRIGDYARVNPQPKHPRTGQFAKAHVVARETRRSKRTGQFRKQGLDPAEQRKEELAEARFSRVRGKLDVVTAGDDRVCDVCDGISDGGPYTINQARGLIPAHPNCRCLFTAAGAMRDAFDFDPDQARDDKGKWTLAYHGTRREGLERFSLLTEPEENFNSPSELGFHFAKDPEISNAFTEMRFNEGERQMQPGGHIIPVKLPPDEQFMPVPQPPHPYVQPGEKITNRNIEGDDAAIRKMISAKAYPEHPDILASWLEMARAVPEDGSAAGMADKLIKGETVDLPIDGPQTLHSLVENFSGAEPYDKEDKHTLVRTARKKWQAEGWKGLKYVNTSPTETGEEYGVKDFTSYIVFDPKDVKGLYTGDARLRDFDPDEPRDPQGRWTALQGSQGHYALVSTAPITAKGRAGSEQATELVAAKNRYTRIDMALLDKDPDAKRKMVELFRDPKMFPMVRANEWTGDTDKDAKLIVDRMKSNLNAMWADITPEEVKSWRGWYDGAHNLIGDRMKQYEKFGIDRASMTAVYAAQSPNTEWDVNVHLGDRLLDTVLNHATHKFDAAMGDAAKVQIDNTVKGIADKEKKTGKTATAARQNLADMQQLFKEIDGKTLNGLTDLTAQAAWVKLYNDAHDTEPLRQVNVDGSFGDIRRKKPTPAMAKRGQEGDPMTGAFGTLDRIANAITALNSHGDANVLSEAVGDKHKVRSFYNNMLDPGSANDDVTIDTHAGGAAWLFPFGGKDTQVQQMLGGSVTGGKAPPSSAVTGIKGSYPFYADAYREFAHQTGVLKHAREAQSVLWMKKIQLFRNVSDANKALAWKAWNDYHDGKQSLAKTQAEVLRIAKS